MSDETTVVEGELPVAPVGSAPVGSSPVESVPSVDVGGDGPVKPTAEVATLGSGTVLAPIDNPVLLRLKAILHAFENESVTIARDLAKAWHDEF